MEGTTLRWRDIARDLDTRLHRAIELLLLARGTDPTDVEAIVAVLAEIDGETT